MLHASTVHAAGWPRLHAAWRVTAQTMGARARRALERWQERRFENAMCRALYELDDRTLHDLGLDRSQIGPGLFRDDTMRRSQAAPDRQVVSNGKVARAHCDKPGKSASSRLTRITARIAAGIGAAVVALGLAGAQLGLADHYARLAELSARAASADARVAAAQIQDKLAAR
jgi:uncharacterized protein YjiS (DUF1127 family)